MRRNLRVVAEAEEKLATLRKEKENVSFIYSSLSAPYVLVCGAAGISVAADPTSWESCH